MNEAETKREHGGCYGVAKALVVLGFTLQAFQMDFLPWGDGVDSSWQFLINDAAHRGQDFIFTCGPLGFIGYPMNVGANLDIALLVRLLFWLGFAGLFGGLVWRHYFSLPHAALFICALGLLGPVSYDYFLCLLGLFLLALALEVKPWWPLYGVVLALSAFLALMKLSAGLLMLCSCLVFVGLHLFVDKKKVVQALGLTLAVFPLFFSLLYLGCNPSLSSLLAYVRWGLEISSGYSVAMSTNGIQLHLWLALLIGFISLVSLALLYRYQERSYRVALLCLPSSFFVFKHGFVRPDEHVLHFFTFTPLLLALVWLFTPFRRSTAWLVLLPLAALNCSLSVLGYSRSLSNLTGLGKMALLRQTCDYRLTKADLKNISEPLRAAYTLPREWSQVIGQQTVSIFPAEAAYVWANPLSFQSFPVIQAYAAYTRGLDRLNADFLENPLTAPKFILMQWLTIDWRHPLMDVPATWLALFQWYEVHASRDSPHLLCLLKRRTQPRFGQWVWLERREVALDEPLEIPRSAHPVVMKASLRLTWAGQLAKFFFRVPRVSLDLIGSHGWQNHRLIPDTLENGLFINHLPLMQADFCTLMDHQPAAGGIDRVKFKGRGLGFYQNRLQDDFYTLPEVSIRELAPPANSSGNPDESDE